MAENNQEYSKEEYAEHKRAEKTEIYNLIDTMAEKVVASETEFKKYLDTQSKFDSYSLGNALLVLAQMPKATTLKDYDGWNKSNSYLKRFAKGVKILEPAGEYMREDGTVATNYNVKKVYDISQVNTRQKVNNMRYNDKVLLRIFINSSSSGKVEIVEDIPDTNRKALYDMEKDVLYVRKGVEVPTTFLELSEELAREEIGDMGSFENKCISYMLCKKYGIDVSGYNFSEVQSKFQNMEAREIREELEPVQKGLKEINARVTDYIQKLTRESKSKDNKDRER